MKIKNDRDFGRKGEKIAVRYLKRLGYKILNKNYKCKVGEIDIIARDGAEAVFVEVKTRRPDPSVRGAYAVNSRKREHIMKTASYYMAEERCALQPRFDIIEVELDRETGKTRGINHIKAAFIQNAAYSRF